MYRTKARQETAASRIQTAWRKRKPRKRRIPLALKQHNFVERLPNLYQQISNVEPTGTTNGLLQLFKFSDIPQASHYQDLFEFYRIDKIVIEFRYKSIAQSATFDTASTTTVQQNELNPVMYFKRDHDTDFLINLPQLKESSKTREHQFTNNKPNFTVQLKPSCLINTANIKGSSGILYRPKWGQWLSTTDANIEHYGLMSYVIGYNGAQPGSLEVTRKMYFSLKNND
jgi:hypothetical protein